MTKGHQSSTNPPSNPAWPNGLDWDDVLDVFPYDEPRDVQHDGMQTALDAASDNGFLLMEGACGTGKTLIALAPYISLVRNPNTKYERIVVVTSVKQQQRAFEDEVEQINEKLRSNGNHPVSALTLVGKADVCPYVQQGTIGQGEIYDDCDRLRQNTSEIISGDGGRTKKSGRQLVSEAGADHGTNPDEEPYYVFDEYIPQDEENNQQFCPYYAQHLENKAEERPIPASVEEAGMVTPQRLLTLAGGAGTCPHSVMGEMLSEAEVIIANYYHLFEPTTVQTFTGELLDESSLLVVDEAHNLVPRVRDLLTREKSLSSFDHAIKETRDVARLAQLDGMKVNRLASAVGAANDFRRSSLTDDLHETYDAIAPFVSTNALQQHGAEVIRQAHREAQDKLDAAPVETADLHEWADALVELQEAVIDREVTRKFKEFNDNNEAPPFEFNVLIRDPEDADAMDSLSNWLRLTDKGEALSKGMDIAATVEGVQAHLRTEVLEMEETPNFRSLGVAEFLSNWREFDNTRYFRTIQMERNQYSDGPDAVETDFEWTSEYTATLSLYNCLPREDISETIAEFGGGILMSATLEPLDAYREVIGLDLLEADGRPVYEKQFGLSFPEENRMSYVVDVPAFKYNNKKQPFVHGGQPNTNNRVREQYAQAIFNVVQTTPGNALIAMPSYSEAEWAGTLLRQHPDIDADRVLVDESSTNHQTERMKQEFFESDDAILVTGALGTLTEGVDYKGDRLNAVVCCGVPIENTNNVYSKAVRTAYESEFGKSNGFEYAFTVPAVHKTRQALGRVIRTDDDVGVRVLVDGRYATPEDERGDRVDWQKVMALREDGKSWRAVRKQLHIKGSAWDNVRRFLSPGEQMEFQDVQPDTLFNQLRAFWKFHGRLE